MLVVAGAGTGKTHSPYPPHCAPDSRKVIALPHEILAVTYTNNAARGDCASACRSELRGMDLSGLRLVTFHKYCAIDLLQQMRPTVRSFLDDKDLLGST